MEDGRGPLSENWEKKAVVEINFSTNSMFALDNHASKGSC